MLANQRHHRGYRTVPLAAVAWLLLAPPAASWAEPLVAVDAQLSPALAVPPVNQLADNSGGSSILSESSKSSAPPPTVAPVSLAEQITRLERTIEADRKHLEQLRAEVTSPSNEFNMAEAAFKAIDNLLSAKKEEIAELAEMGQTPTTEQEVEFEELTSKWKLARERFDLAIDTRKTLQQQLTALEEKLAQSQKALDKLKGDPAPEAAPTETVAPATSPADATATPASPAVASPPIATAVPSPAPSVSPAAADVASSPAASGPSVEALTSQPKQPSKKLLDAQSDAQQKKVQALAAEEEAKSITERIAAAEKDIALERKLVVAAQKKSDIAFQTGSALEDEYEKKACEGAPLAELEELRSKRRDAQALFARARMEVRQSTDRLSALQEQLANLQREELAAIGEAQARQEEADQAERKVLELSNPYSVENVLQWLVDHGPKIGLILLVMLILRLSASLSSQRVVSLIIERGARGTKQEREDRARTLLGVFRNAFSITIIIGGGLMLCEEVGIAVGPLMGGAAVLGLAAAFGAQNLIRDYFYGFVILIENQYKINDVLRIGTMTGQVEQITLRMTVLRDLEGNVHFIPNGKIDSVTNMTHGWSRAMLDVSVAYKENLDQVMDVLVDLAIGMRRDPQFAPLIIDDPEMLGVDGLNDSGVVIKLLLKTRPLQQWKVKRELLRRIKRRFDELGIEIPFPQRMVHHRVEVESSEKEPRLTTGLPWESRKAA